MEDELADPVLRAEKAGLAVLLPALSGDYGDGFAATAAMSAAVAAVLTTASIRRLWMRASSRATDRARSHWMSQARNAGILNRVRSPELTARARTKWIGDNVERYVLIRDKVRAETERHMRLGRDRGMKASTMAGDLEANGLPTHHGRMRGRGKVIAADQLSTLSGLIAARQQKDAAIDEFVWHTMRDSRVRDKHASLGGRTFKWSKPPGIIPGEEINCRCWAEGIVN